MKRAAVVALTLFAFGAMAGTASAQIGARPIDIAVCNTALYDQNRDGVLSPLDIVLWANAMRATGCYEAEAVGDCVRFDNNGDGRIDGLDVEVMARHWAECTRAAPISVQPQRPR